jgi:hypothetical protein
MLVPVSPDLGIRHILQAELLGRWSPARARHFYESAARRFTTPKPRTIDAPLMGGKPGVTTISVVIIERH